MLLGAACLALFFGYAGVMALEDKAAKDGYDVQMQTNHLSHFLLTALLWERLLAAPEGARVVQHSSGVHVMPVRTNVSS